MRDYGAEELIRNNVREFVAHRWCRHDRATPDQKLSFTETALDYAFEALQTLVNVMRASDNDAARVSAAGKILDRALGKAPQHVDVAAIKHTEIVYRAAWPWLRVAVQTGTRSGIGRGDGPFEPARSVAHRFP
jgi:hypothetical protein